MLFQPIPTASLGYHTPRPYTTNLLGAAARSTACTLSSPRPTAVISRRHRGGVEVFTVRPFVPPQLWWHLYRFSHLGPNSSRTTNKNLTPYQTRLTPLLHSRSLLIFLLEGPDYTHVFRLLFWCLLRGGTKGVTASTSTPTLRRRDISAPILLAFSTREQAKVAWRKVGWMGWMRDNGHDVFCQKLLWAGALSWWRNQSWLLHISGRFSVHCRVISSTPSNKIVDSQFVQEEQIACAQSH